MDMMDTGSLEIAIVNEVVNTMVSVSALFGRNCPIPNVIIKIIIGSATHGLVENQKVYFLIT